MVDTEKMDVSTASQDPRMRSLQKGIEERQKELHNLVVILGKHAHKTRTISSVMKVGIIVMGAITATKGASDKIIGADNEYNLLIYTIIGLVITIFSGVEAAFKLEKKATELSSLAASCKATVISVDGDWRRTIGSESDSDRRESARKLLQKQEDKLSEIHEKAANNGLSVHYELRKLEDPEDANDRQRNPSFAA